MTTAVKPSPRSHPKDVESKICREGFPYQKAEPHNSSDDHQERPEMVAMFRKLWCTTTDDNRFTLFGFRRFRTAHLLNLRFLEDEIHKIDHEVYQAGLQLEVPCTSADKLGLKHCRRDEGALGIEAVIKPELILCLRSLLKQYDETLIAFNQIMLMETFALADHNGQSNLRNDLNPYETYKTRLLRVDLPPRRDSRDLLRHSLRKFMRSIWFYFLSGRASGHGKQEDRSYSSASELESRLKKSHQNTSLIAEFLTRFLVALLASTFLIVPLILLSLQSTQKAHLITVSVFIIVFAFIVSLLSKASNSETMAAAAAYAAVLVVFVSNSSGKYGTN